MARAGASERTEMLLSQRLAAPPAKLAAFCRKWRIARLEVFGSLLREDFRAESDADFLVTFEAGKAPRDIDWWQIKDELAELSGRDVDLVERRLVERSRNLYRRHQILREATTIHGS
jgi:uncharacterized protein